MGSRLALDFLALADFKSSGCQIQLLTLVEILQSHDGDLQIRVIYATQSSIFAQKSPQYARCAAILCLNLRLPSLELQAYRSQELGILHQREAKP